MEYFDEINDLKYLFMIDLREPNENELLIRIKEATISSQNDDLIIEGKKLGTANSINVDGPGKIYEFYFDAYASYCVTNESFTVKQQHNIGIGELFCIYSQSAFLDYMRKETVTEFVQGRELKHFRIACLNHIIEITSTYDPVIKKI